LLNLVGGMHTWPGPRVQEAAVPEPPPAAAGTTVNYRGGPLSETQVVGAIRECFDPEIPLNIYDLGLIYGIDIDESGIAVKMTLTSEGCPSARTIPEDVKRKIAARAGSGGAGEVPFVAHLRHAAEHEATKAHRLLALGLPAKDAWHARGPSSAAGRRGRRRSAYEAPRAAAEGGTRFGGAEPKRRRRPRLPAPPSRVTLIGRPSLD